MKYFIPMIALSVCASGALAAPGHGSARPAMSNKIMSAPRYTASVNQLNGMSGNTSVATNHVSNATGNTNMFNVNGNGNLNNNNVHNTGGVAPITC